MGYYGGGFINTDPIQAIPSIVSVVAGQGEPVTLAEAKRYLRIENNDRDDAQVQSFINTSITRAEKYLNSDILAKNRELVFNRLESDPFSLLFAPLNLERDADGALTNFTISVTDGDTDTVLEEGDGWDLLGGGNDPLIRFDYQAYDVKIEYVTSGLPFDEYKAGLLAMIYQTYYNDGSEQGKWQKFFSPLRRVKYMGIR